jgi:hypothetical protein
MIWKVKNSKRLFKTKTKINNDSSQFVDLTKNVRTCIHTWNSLETSIDNDMPWWYNSANKKWCHDEEKNVYIVIETTIHKLFARKIDVINVCQSQYIYFVIESLIIIIRRWVTKVVELFTLACIPSYWWMLSFLILGAKVVACIEYDCFGLRRRYPKWSEFENCVFRWNNTSTDFPENCLPATRWCNSKVEILSCSPSPAVTPGGFSHSRHISLCVCIGFIFVSKISNIL